MVGRFRRNMSPPLAFCGKRKKGRERGRRRVWCCSVGRSGKKREERREEGRSKGRKEGRKEGGGEEGRREN